MRWLIVEDALKDRKGHWLEWVSTFDRGFRELGDQVTILADSEVEPDIRESLRVEPVLPRSIWHRMSDGSARLTRYSRVFVHNWQTWRVMSRYLRAHLDFDAVFVPTVSVHHLLAWARLIKGPLRNRKTRVLLFFLTGPMSLDSAGRIVPDRSVGCHLLRALLRWMAPEIRTGKVVLGVETKAMQMAFQELIGLPLVWFPQPVASLVVRNPPMPGEWIEMASFGAARAEKGSDILQEAIEIHHRKCPSSRARFTIQWIEDFNAAGRRVIRSPVLQENGIVRYITQYFRQGEYADNLQRTDVVLLPYRLSSYGLRGSRAVIEAAVNGIPVVTTRGTTLAGIAEEFATGVLCEDGDPESLAGSIAEMESKFEEKNRQAKAARGSAVERFSVREFRRIFADSAKNASAAKGAAVALSPLPARDGSPKVSHEP